MNVTLNTYTTFGRLGNHKDVKAKANEAKKAGAVVVVDKDAETVEAKTEDGRKVFSAIHKGGNVWIIIYSTEFYAKPE
jgi:hypothetical protein